MKANTSPLISIVIPVCNEAENLPLLVSKLEEVLTAYPNREYLFVDDGSSDASVEVLTELQAGNKNIRVLKLTRNFGHQPALYAGLSRANGDAVITMDADLQDPPECLPRFISSWKSGNKVVYGRRKNRQSDGWFKRLSARVYYRLLTKFSTSSIPEHVGDFRLLDRQVVDDLLAMNRKDPFVRGMIAYLGYTHDFVDYERPIRNSGDTKYTFAKMFSLALNGLLSFSTLPLKLGLFLGIISIATGSFFLLYIIYDTLMNHEVYPLYKWLVVFLFMFNGLMFILLWILSEYVSRLFRQNQDKPMFVIEKEQ